MAEPGQSTEINGKLAENLSLDAFKKVKCKKFLNVKTSYLLCSHPIGRGERNMSVLNLIRRILSVMFPLSIYYRRTSFVQAVQFYNYINVKQNLNFYYKFDYPEIMTSKGDNLTESVNKNLLEVVIKKIC